MAKRVAETVTKITNSEKPLSSTVKGRIAELVAMTAFASAGWTVMEPTSAETFDFAVTKPGTPEIKRIQVKCGTKRVRDGVEYYVIKGRRNNGVPYTLDEADFFAGVIDDEVYVVENSELSEYWQKAENARESWNRLSTGL